MINIPLWLDILPDMIHEELDHEKAPQKDEAYKTHLPHQWSGIGHSPGGKQAQNGRYQDTKVRQWPRNSVQPLQHNGIDPTWKSIWIHQYDSTDCLQEHKAREECPKNAMIAGEVRISSDHFVVNDEYKAY